MKATFRFLSPPLSRYQTTISDTLPYSLHQTPLTKTAILLDTALELLVHCCLNHLIYLCNCETLKHKSDGFEKIKHEMSHEKKRDILWPKNKMLSLVGSDAVFYKDVLVFLSLGLLAFNRFIQLVFCV